MDINIKDYKWLIGEEIKVKTNQTSDCPPIGMTGKVVRVIIHNGYILLGIDFPQWDRGHDLSYPKFPVSPPPPIYPVTHGWNLKLEEVILPKRNIVRNLYVTL